MIEYIKIIGSTILTIGLLYFIVLNAFKTINYMRKALITSILSLILLIYFGSGFISDLSQDLTKIGKARNIIIIVIVFIYAVSFITYYLIAAKKNNHHLKRSFKHSQKTGSEQYLYILYRYQDMYLLKEEDNSLAAEVVKFDRNCFFYDEMINKYLTKHNIKSVSSVMHGTATIYKKKKVIFYCFEINLLNVADNLDTYKAIYKMDLVNAPLTAFHKNLIFRMLLNEQFNIELKDEN